jgi:hypothetical protein
MANHSYPVEVQSDFLEKITRAKPVHAVAEFIWNSLDADASTITVTVEQNDLGAMSKIVIRDNGTGMKYEKAAELFRSLGGSWKRLRATTEGGRFLHGQDGRGRFKAFGLGRVAEWDVVYQKEKKLYTFMVTMTAANIKEVVISDEEPANAEKRKGVTLTISELHKDFRSLASDAGAQELTEIFALYLSDYQNVSISVAGTRIDPSKVIASKGSVNLSDVTDEGKAYPVRVEIIEWRTATNRALYLCNEKGFPLSEIERRFHVGPFQFSAYLKSEYISKLQKEGTLELAEMNPLVVRMANEAQEAIKDYFRDRASQEARTVVQEGRSCDTR